MQPQALFFMGDIHGDFGAILRFVIIQDIRNAHIIQVGDFGLGFMEDDAERKLLARLNRILQERTIYLYAIRGNHDKPSCFLGHESRLPHITFLPDYTVLTLLGKNILCVGGALSIDRCNREQDFNYWLDEPFILDEEKLATYKDIDIVVTHNAPDLVPPFGMKEVNHEYFRRDPLLRTDLVQERLNLTKMFRILKQNPSNKLSYWFYGHFHAHIQTEVEGTSFVLLDLDQAYPFELENSK
jgi:predicted phosphodiesterase